MLRTMAMTAACVVVMCGTEAYAASRPAMMASPQPNAAMVSSMPGLVNGEKAMTIAGKEKTIWDGIVLRATRIKANGTLVIPPAGLYTTARSGNWRPFDNEPVRLAGKSLYYLNQRSARDVLHDITMTPGQVVPMNPEKSRGWELSSISTETFFMPDAYSATFKLVKSTGNYYGTSFPVTLGANVSDNANSGKFAKGYFEKAGRTKAQAGDPLDVFAIGNNMAISGRSYVIVDEITPEYVKIREMGSDSCTDAWISPTAPTIASYAKGDTFTIGNAQVKVTDLGADTVTVAVTEDGKTLTKTFGPWNNAARKDLFLSEATRDKFWTLSPGGKEIIHLNVNNPEGPFVDGKTSLVAYQDVIDVQDGSDWPFDDRFRVRPET